MSVWEIIIGVVLIIFSLLIICVVLLQEGRQANLGAISGAADSFLDKGRAGRWMLCWPNGPRSFPSPFLCWYLPGC